MKKSAFDGIPKDHIFIFGVGIIGQILQQQRGILAMLAMTIRA